MHILSAAAALLFAATACTQDDLTNGTLPEGECPLVINATGLQAVATPASRATVDGDWQGVQTVALSVGGTVKEYNVTASDADGYKTATLSSDTDPFWWTSREDITVSAWWPYGATMPDVVVKEDQSTKEGFEGSDFIAAEAQTVQFDNPTLEFSHRTARITVNLKPGDGITSVTGADVYVTGLGTDGGNPTTISTYNAIGTDTYEALAAPQTVKAKTPFIQLDLDRGTYYFRPQSDVALVAGCRYTYTVSVTAKGLELAGCTIGGWTEGGGENGTADDLGYTYNADTHTYRVYNADGLLAWNEAAQSDPKLNCTLTADINLIPPADGENNWTPISDYVGTFDGGGHSIDNLTFNTTEEKQGMFTTLEESGVVNNLTLGYVEIAGGRMTGSIAGYNYGTITNCAVSGNVKGATIVGGIVGTNVFGTIADCNFNGVVMTDEDGVGGIAGGNSQGHITNCHSSGTVGITGAKSGEIGGGGIVGINEGGIVIACHSSSDITSSVYVGGVIGDNDDGGIVVACYSTGNVTGGSNVGGVVGNHHKESFLVACYATGEVEGGMYGGGSTAGVVGRIYESTVTACYWSGSEIFGSGTSSDDGETTKVNGRDVTWMNAVEGMNAAINEWNGSHADQQCDWIYQTSDANTPPALSAK